MVNQDVLRRLFRAFPKSIINTATEFVAYHDPRVNSCFYIGSCETEEDVAAKVLEWLSREAFKSKYYSAAWRTKKVREYHLRGINRFLGTSFKQDDIALIYYQLGNCINHEKTLRFIRSGYNMEVLQDG